MSHLPTAVATSERWSVRRLFSCGRRGGGESGGGARARRAAHLGAGPGARRDLADEELAGLGEDDGRLGAHHHVLAAVELRLDLVLELHDALDARQRQLELADVDGRGLTEGLGRLLEEAGDEGVVHGAPRTARAAVGGGAGGAFGRALDWLERGVDFNAPQLF